MKKILITVGAVIVVTIIASLVIAFRANGGDREPQVETSFVGFSNSPAGPLALVAVHFRPRFGGANYETFQAFHKSRGLDWEPWMPPPGDARLPSGMINRHVIFYAVENTNDTWRFVLGVNENPPGDTPFVRRVRKWWDKLRSIPPPLPEEFAGKDGFHYSLTNETSERN